MAKRKYDEVSVCRSLSKKHDISIDTQRKVIEVVKNNTTVGNGSWGKIDYLCNYCGYRAIMVNGISARKRNDVQQRAEDNVAAKFNIKINMAETTKNAMKKVKFK